MKNEIRTALWSVNTKIDKGGNDTNAVHTLSMTERVNLLGKVVDRAYEHLASDVRSASDNNNVDATPVRRAFLFVAPEYLFAESDRAHLISEDRKRDVVLRLQAMSHEHNGMILVPGTIAWKKPALRPVDERFKKDPHTGLRTGPEKVLSRFAKATDRITRAGMERHGLATHVVDRQFAEMSPNVQQAMAQHRTGMVKDEREKAWSASEKANAALDKNLQTAPERCFLARNTLYAFYNGAEVGRSHKRADYYEVFDDEADGGYVIFEPGAPGDGRGNRFAVDGLRFGVEICKDHAVGYLSQRSPEQPDVQVLVSAAVQVVTEHGFVPPGCYLVHASSDPECTGIWLNTGFGVEKVDTETEGTGFAGSVLHYGTLRFDTAS